MLASFAQEMGNVFPANLQVYDYSHARLEIETFIEREWTKFQQAQVPTELVEPVVKQAVDPVDPAVDPVEPIPDSKNEQAAYVSFYSKMSVHVIVWMAFINCFVPFIAFGTWAKKA